MRKDLDWDRLGLLRARFLSGAPIRGDGYWQTRQDLELYDETFAQRIGFKWDAALADLVERGFVPPTGTVVDWACGTAIASRTYLLHFGVDTTKKLILTDRSRAAEIFAHELVKERWPEVKSKRPRESQTLEPDVLLISHVLNELDDDDLEELMALAKRARCVLWLEPGDKHTSRLLGTARRELLAEGAQLLGPCPHSGDCALLAEGRERDWCHFFAPPPNDVFTDGGWALFGREVGIDLRSLPYSWLAVLRADEATPLPAPLTGERRLLGRPRVHKGYALIDACHANGEVTQLRVMKRTEPELYKRLRSGP